MRLETIPEAKDITWVCPGSPMLFDVDVVADNIPDDMAFGMGIAEEFKSIFMTFDASTTPPLQSLVISDGLKLTVEVPASATSKFKGKKKLVWILYELRSGQPLPCLKGPIRLDGGAYFTGFKP